MAYQPTSKLDEAIKKYGGGDAQYELELKKQIREGMGYSNFLSKRNALQGQDVNLPDVEGMTPAGIKSMVGGAIGMQESEMNSLDRILGGVDSAAGSLASASAARSRASAANKKDNPFEDVQPKNWVESEVLAYAKNPYNQDGTLKTREQLRKELEGQFIGEGGVNDIQGVTESTIQETINSMLPEDYDGNERFYKYKSLGYTDSEARDIESFDKYANNEMSDLDKKIYEAKNPGWASRAEKYRNDTPDLSNELQFIEDPNTGQKVPKYESLDKLLDKYPRADEEELKEKIKPMEANDAKDTVDQFYQNNKEALDDILNSSLDDGGGFNGMLSSPEVKEFKERLKVVLRERKVFTDTEINNMVDTYLFDNVKGKF